ncbi:hypothetical protein [Flammeovirga sp. SubArs3]|uniref:hypothetical protein n=1 Tax=Flammeovirga sp. SubArs3 TaxID=2995316 RepID=UPI00248ABDBA|nr:hypothetical protein [Flammeovirga sp. SubArs3]
MKRPITILFFILFSHLTFADEPPCWCEFSIKSNNGVYQADIEFEKSDSLKEPWERRWTIKVYDMKLDTSLIWSSKFFQDGYGGGVLSNDGQIYVYLNDWLDMKEPPNQVVIYTPQKTLRFSGKDLGLNPDNYSHTVSHKIWIDEYELIPNRLSDSTNLRIKTDDLKEILINVKSSKIENSIANPEFVEENNILKKYGIGILIFIGLGILLITLKNKKRA